MPKKPGAKAPRLHTLAPRVKLLDAARLKAAPRAESTPRLRGERWMHIREAWLRAHPMCAECERRGEAKLAQQVDHVVPLADGGRDDGSNYQSLCVPCHAAKSASEAKARAG